MSIPTRVSERSLRIISCYDLFGSDSIKISPRSRAIRIRHPRVVPQVQIAFYGKVNATNASLNVLLYLLPPPAAITMNCLPVCWPRNVIGVA